MTDKNGLLSTGDIPVIVPIIGECLIWFVSNIIIVYTCVRLATRNQYCGCGVPHFWDNLQTNHKSS